MVFPPETLREKLKWYLFPWFPRRYLVLYDKTGDVYEFIDDEIENIVRSKHITMIKCRYGTISKTAIVPGEDPFVYATLLTPGEMFGRFTINWSTTWLFILYTVFMIMAMMNIFNEYMIMALISLTIYVMSISKVKFHTPSIQYISLHEYGIVSGYPAYVPGPVPESKLSFSQVMRFTGKLHDPSYKDKMLKDLLKEAEVAKEIIKRLYGVIVRIERQSDKIYDSTYRLAQLMTSDVLEEIQSKAERIIARQKRFWTGIAIVALIIGLIIGYMAGSSVGVGVAAP